MNVLVTGATGYVGGRLLQRLLERDDVTVRVLVRDSERARARTWADRVEIVEGDLLDRESLAHALKDVDAAYYLVHSMCGVDDFAATDRQAAHNFVAEGQHLRQVIYLGGITPTETPDRSRSEHLHSRYEVGQILRDGLPTTELRAGPVIGSGSASFEMVRYLTERLPVMVAPRWILNEVQPIAVRDALSYLTAALGREDALGVIDVGTEALTFKEMMERYAEVRGLPRVIIPVPVLAPRLAALWVGLVTPIPNCLAVPLVEGVVQPVVADTSRARALFPEIEPMSYRDAVARALARTEAGDVVTRWSVSGGAPDPRVELVDEEGVIREVRTRHVGVAAQHVFRAFTSLGGDRGWRTWGWAWEVRGFIDQLFGGPGLRRGRRHPDVLYPGEALDFWRVEEYQPHSLLRLRAEMKVPGKAWLQFEAIPEEGGAGTEEGSGQGAGTRLVQTAFFAPTGFLGWLYWYGIYPLHALIFSDLVEAIARDAEDLAGRESELPLRAPALDDA